MINLVVTRHTGLVEYLKELGLVSNGIEVISHAGPDQISGKDVCGVLPHSFSCLCNSFTEIPLNLPQELRGKELGLEELRKYAGSPVTYKITKLV